MKRKVEIYLLILKSLAVDYAKKLWETLVTPSETPSKNSEIRQEATRLFLLGRYRAARMEKHTRYRLTSVGVTVLAVLVVFSVVASAQVFSVSVNGQVVGYINEKDDYAYLVNNVKEKISKENGNSEILIQEADIELIPTLNLGLASMSVFSVHDEEALLDDQSVDQEAPAVDNSKSVQMLSVDQENSDSTVNAESGAPAQDSSDNDNSINDTPTPLADEPADAGLVEVPKTEDVTLEDALIDTLIRGDAVKATVYRIEINGRPVAALATLKDASDVLQNVANAYKIDLQDPNSGFIDDVQIGVDTLDLNAVKIESVDEVTDFLLTGINNTRTYTTKEDDTIQDIAEAFSITEEELLESYPDTDFLLVKEGDVFEYVVNTPYLQYKTSVVEEVDLPIQYETIEKRTNTLYFGEREAEIEGEFGIKHVKRTVTRINDVIVSVEEHSSEVVKEPSTATVLVGTLFRPEDLGFKSETGEGVLGRPLDSWSLSRSVGGAHQGSDMLAPQGTPIYAAEAGTVLRADWYSAYGLFVSIDHGNGLQTYYAHCDTINVAAGQTVERGQQIATVGITGRATAYHLHFEVRVDGSVQEPMDWID